MIMIYCLICMIWLFFVYLTADWLIQVFAGSTYAFSASLLPIVLSGYLIEVGVSIVGTKLLLLGKTKIWATLYVVQGCIFLLMSLYLVPTFGLIGLAYAFLISKVAYLLTIIVKTVSVAEEFDTLVQLTSEKNNCK